MAGCACNELMQLGCVGGLDFSPTTVGGVTAGQARHNSSNVGGVTAGQVRHNSSQYNVGNLILVLNRWEVELLRMLKRTEEFAKKTQSNLVDYG